MKTLKRLDAGLEALLGHAWVSVPLVLVVFLVALFLPGTLESM